MLNGLEAVLRVLDRIGVVPVALKGAASLLTDLYPDPGIRILGDLDLLVPQVALGQAAQELREAGFDPAEPPRRWFPIETHQLPIQHHKRTGVGVELHRSVVSSEFRRLLGTPAVFEAACWRDFRRLAVLVPSPTDRVLHNIVHTQLADGNYKRGSVALRQILELALLSSRYEAQIDWTVIRARFAAAGRLPLLRDTMGIVAGLFGVPVPSAVSEPASDPLIRLREAVERPRGLSPLSVLGAYARHVRRQPRCLFNVFDPRSWSGRLASMRKRLQTPEW